MHGMARRDEGCPSSDSSHTEADNQSAGTRPADTIATPIAIGARRPSVSLIRSPLVINTRYGLSAWNADMAGFRSR
jgi:hypothetical protein